MSGFTKEIIAKTFTELLDEKPMSKITVKDIVERCGVNRNTFYYHFKDIPDVVEFILKKKWDEILEHPQDRASILECMEEMADLVRNNRKVMFNVYRSVKKDTFLFYMNEISNYIIMEYFRKNADQFDLDEGEIRILIQYYKCLFMGFLMEWPGIYVSRKDPVGGSMITTFDIRMTSPNEEPVMNTAELHTIEHLAATFLRNHKEFGSKMIYWGPMGCRTGNYLLLNGDYESKDIVPLMIETFEFIRDFEGEVPGASAKDCGNYLDMNLPMAKYLAGKFLDEVLYDIKPDRLIYPQ